MGKRKDLLEAIEKFDLRAYNIITPKINELAEKYIEHKIIPFGKYEDALHIAFATYYDFDILLSRNFKHLANINKTNGSRCS